MAAKKIKSAKSAPTTSANGSSQVEALLDSLNQWSTRPVVLFFGAGASKPFGYPLTGELLLKIMHGLQKRTILYSNRTGPGATGNSPREELSRFLDALLPGERLSQATLPMVTGVLSMLDFSLAGGQALLPGWTLEDTRRARQLLERAILEVIPDHEDWDESKTAEKQEQERFDEFCNLVEILVQRRPKGGVGIITTNYDMLADLLALRLASVEGEVGDWSMADLARKVDFGFRWIHPDRADREDTFSRPEHPEITLLKLHGSTNWLRCPLCENIYINPNGPIAWLAHNKATRDNSCHCSPSQLETQIVSPSFVRDMRQPNLIAVWKVALDFLRSADHWVFVGYSFPNEDVGIRALVTRAFGASGPRREISVIEWDDKARVNYECFFPHDRVHYLTGGLERVLECARKRRES